MLDTLCINDVKGVIKQYRVAGKICDCTKRQFFYPAVISAIIISTNLSNCPCVNNCKTQVSIHLKSASLQCLA